jgi:uncharacterized membrane protein YebE (DUF533 family)
MTILSDSRFHMWRAVFALAHADGKVTDQERRFMQIYLSRLNVSPEQKKILEADIEQRQEVALMFSKITVEKDIEEFFNFARLLVWCDGDFGEQEKQIMDLLHQRHDTPLGRERTLLKLQASGRKKMGLLQKLGKSAQGLKDLFDVFTEGGSPSTEAKGPGVSESQFYMWRAVFAMAHADNIVTEEEKKYLHGILSRERFTPEQKRILEADILTPQDIASMFVKIDDQSDRSQFFYHARMLVWSDGDFGEQEQKIILRLKQTHVRTIDFDQIMKNLDLSLDEEQRVRIVQDRERVMDVDHREGFLRRVIRQISGR